MTTAQRLVLVAALGRNRALGIDQQLLWRLPGDLPRFKALTQGKALVMGRKTFDSIGRALPGRRTIVVTRDPQWAAPGVEVASSLDTALELAGPGEVCCGGGGEIYAQALDRADRLELTEVDDAPEADTYFPERVPADWREVAREDVPARDDTPAFSWVSYERVPPRAGS